MKKILFKKKIVTTFIIIVAVLVSNIQLIFAYDTKDSMKPTNLTIEMKLKTKPIHNIFTRYIKFVNKDNKSKLVAVKFARHSGLTYYGEVTSDGLKVLESMVNKNNRTYWDTMYFVNQNGSTVLDIDKMEVWIEYGNHKNSSNGNWDPDVMIAYVTNKVLETNDSFYMSKYAGRKEYIKAYFGWSDSYFYSLPQAVRFFIYDLGKSGSSDNSDSYKVDVDANNPKYAASGQNLCSETVSWYYYKYNVRIKDVWNDSGKIYDFKDIGSHAVMLDQFHYANRRYDYHSGRGKWIRKDKNNNWVYSDAVLPKPGDYLDRKGDHAMMILKWDDTNKIAYVLDGPFPINIRKVPVGELEEADKKDFALGKIPEND